jgi:hypothetical protein
VTLLPSEFDGRKVQLAQPDFVELLDALPTAS